MAIHQKTTAFLNRPFYLLISSKPGWYYTSAFAALISLLLCFEQPFGLHHWHHPLKYLIISGFGLIFFAIYMLYCWLATYIFPESFCNKSWTVGKQVTTSLILFVTIGTANWLYSMAFINQAELSVVSFLQIQFHTLIFGILPQCLLLMFQSKQLIRTQFGLPAISNNTKRETFTIKDEVIDINDIVLFKANENYVFVHYLQDGKLKRKDFRFTMKKVEKELNQYPQFARCHKSYLINKNYIRKHTGGHSNPTILLHHFDQPIPASRNYIQKLKMAA